MKTSREWEDLPENLSPIAAQVGPFPHRPFLETVWENRSNREAELHIEYTETGGVALSISRGTIEFVGRPNLTDYHSPIGEGGASALVSAIERLPDKQFILDSLPLEATEPIAEILKERGITHRVRGCGSTAVLSLPDTYEEWLVSLSKKQRHEVRRKRRRLEAELGEIELEIHSTEAIDMFCTMHRGSTGEKGGFMTSDMQSFFSELTRNAGASIHLLICGGTPRAAAFGFEIEDGYYYYNSAYSSESEATSPGAVLVSELIRLEIERGARTFDFLKGDERYKYQHGAVARDLYIIEGGAS